MHPVDDPERGRWLVDRIGRWGTVGGVAGTGFEAYARILHPARIESRAGARFVRWSDVASASGRVLHPLAQWERICGHDRDDYSAPALGRLDPHHLASLVPLLSAATSAPTPVTVAVWNGWGLNGITPTDTLDLPGRGYHLRSGDLAELADAGWPRTAGLGWSELFDGAMPQLIWPADNAWLIASEIDWDSTIVAGSDSLIASMLAADVEAFPVSEDDSLMSHSDTINVFLSPAEFNSGDPSTIGRPAS